MKIGIFCGGVDANLGAGGGATYHQMVLFALTKVVSKHSFYLFVDDAVSRDLNSDIKIISVRRFLTKKNDSLFKRLLYKGLRLGDKLFVWYYYKSFLNRAVIEYNIDIVWFLIPVYRFVDIPYVFPVWDLQHRLQPYFPEVSVSGSTFDMREKVYSYVLPRATYVITGNQVGKEEIERFYGVASQRIRINPMPTPPFIFEDRQQTTDVLKQFSIKKSYLFYPAQFWPHKNHVVILYALEILNDVHGQDFEAVFTGADKGNLAYIKEVTAMLGLEKRVHFLGFVERNVLIELYKNAFALVFASFFGPDNIPPLEAFGLGCPVIAAHVSGAEYQLEGAALLFDPRSERELVDQILFLQKNAQLRSQLIAEGKVKAQTYSCEQYVHNMLNVFDEFEAIRRSWSDKSRYHHA